MLIRQFGITLERLKEDQIETVRQMRNAPDIQSFMEYREYITPEMQRKWFQTLDPNCDFYFVIVLQNVPVGLIHTSSIDWEQRTGNAGLFVWKKEVQGSHVPVLASLSMVDFFFRFCTLETLFAKVMTDNAVAIRYNARLGFKLAEKMDHKSFLHYSLNKEDYFKSTEKLHEMAKSVSDENNEIVIENDLLNSLHDIGAITQEYRGKLVTVIR